jgi:hypothetical protein
MQKLTTGILVDCECPNVVLTKFLRVKTQNGLKCFEKGRVFRSENKCYEKLYVQFKTISS